MHLIKYRETNILHRKHLSYGRHIWTVDYRLKKMSSTENNFWRRAARTSRISKERNQIIREKWE
jgi:hypothetical protein